MSPGGGGQADIALGWSGRLWKLFDGRGEGNGKVSHFQNALEQTASTDYVCALWSKVMSAFC